MHFPKLVLSLGCFAGVLGVDVSTPGEPTQQKVLFISNVERGLANVLLATAHSMLIDHPEVEVHFASFPKLSKAVEQVSGSALAESSTARPIIFESVAGTYYGQVFHNKNWTLDNAINGPGIKGLTKFTENVEMFLVPWSGPEYVEIYGDLVEKINRINPDVIVLDTVFSPAVDAVRDLDRKHVMLSANQLKDHFAQNQPYGQMFWKYPAINSAYSYPVPWHLIPANIYLTIRLIISAIWTPSLAEKRAYIKEQGLKNPANILTSFRHDVPWISPSVPETEYPMVLPDNVVCAGPIYLDQGSVEDRDPPLAAWLKQRPTIFINLGSNVDYNETDAIEIVQALKPVLDQTDAQVLWKFNKRHPYSDDFMEPVAEYVKADRFKLEKWIAVDPASVLKTGDVALFVHHGGANCFYEGLATGVPTVVLPLWVDLYDYAIRTEWLGVGIWGSRQTAPYWTAGELEAAFMRIMKKSPESEKMAAKAKELGELTRKYEGRRTAAKVIVDYMNGVNATALRGGPGEIRDREL